MSNKSGGEGRGIRTIKEESVQVNKSKLKTCMDKSKVEKE
jgi:hypothetical protein